MHGGRGSASGSRTAVAVELPSAGEAAAGDDAGDAERDVAGDAAAKVDCSAMVEALRGAFLPLNTRKSAWRMPGYECRGFTLGLSLGYGRGLAVPTAATRNFPDLARVLCAACREADPDFRFTSIQVNLNTKYLMHTDGIDAGPSRMICCGNFTGGRMWLHNSTGESWSPMDAQEKWIAFDGREFHLTEEWHGSERWSLVYFTNPCFRRARKSKKGRDTIMELMQLGFRWPLSKDDLFQRDLMREAERREAAARALPLELQDAVVRPR